MCSLTFALGSNVFCSLAHGVIPSDNQPDTAIGIIYSMPVNEIGTLGERTADVSAPNSICARDDAHVPLLQLGSTIRAHVLVGLMGLLV